MYVASTILLRLKTLALAALLATLAACSGDNSSTGSDLPAVVVEVPAVVQEQAPSNAETGVTLPADTAPSDANEDPASLDTIALPAEPENPVPEQPVDDITEGNAETAAGQGDENTTDAATAIPELPVNETLDDALATDSLIPRNSPLDIFVPASQPVPTSAPPPVQPVHESPTLTPDTPLPEPVISAPAGFDTSANAAPFFDNLGTTVVLAGQTMELAVIPRDTDGSIPGLFTGPLPVGSQFRDNFDGTKSIVWRPLEPDVGIHEFSVTAVDAIEPLYRTTQLLRVFVQLPDDLSSIVNLPPAIDLILPHRARAGDELVMLVKGTDPNGHTPQLDILNPPANSTFDVLPDDDRIRVLRWQSNINDTGIHEFHFRVIDAFDSSSIAERTAVVELASDTAFRRPGARLRSLAESRDLYIGYASLKDFDVRPDSGIYTAIAVEEFNMLTTENSVKWGTINPQPNEWRWKSFDKEMQLAYDNDLLVHGHPLIWHQQLPPWISNLPSNQLEGVMLDYISHVITRYGAHVPLWDVVNEALEEDGTYRRSVWFESMGEDYIASAFRQAARNAPRSRLLYNDYDVAWEGPKADGMYRLVTRLLDEGVPLHGVGFQLHIFTDFDLQGSVRQNFQRFADLGLEIYITELDISLSAGATVERQAELYRDIMSLCLEQPACKALQTWGFTDRYSWRGQYDPLIFDRDYNAKPAYFSLQQRLSQSN